MSNFWEAVAQLEKTPTVTVELEYRLYFDNQGSPLYYTMDKPDGQFISITLEQYQRSNYNVKVINGKIKELTNNIVKLVPATSGTACHVNDISIVADDTSKKQHWKLKTNEED